MQDMGKVDLEFEVQKLQLNPGDTLIIKILSSAVSVARLEELKEEITKLLPESCSAFVIAPDVEILTRPNLNIEQESRNGLKYFLHPDQYEDLIDKGIEFPSEVEIMGTAAGLDTRISRDDFLAAYNFVEQMKNFANGFNGAAPWWHGWALREAFFAGILYKQNKRKIASKQKTD